MKILNEIKTGNDINIYPKAILLYDKKRVLKPLTFTFLRYNHSILIKLRLI